MEMNCCEKNREFEQNLINGTRSLFLSGCLLGDDERAMVRELPLPRKNGWCHLQLAVFLYDFFSRSDGGEFTFSSDPLDMTSPLGRNCKDGLDCAWYQVYGETIDISNRRADIISKCFLLKGENEKRDGHTSKIWDCLRDAVHSFRENDGSIEVPSDEGSRKYLRKLLGKDSVERREFYRLVELLAEGASANNDAWKEKVSVDELPAWDMWIKACDRYLKISQSAYVDWYLKFDENFCRTEYIAGFDAFPAGDDGGWRKFKISDASNDAIKKEIPGSFSWAEPIPWNHNVTISYNGKSWNTLKPNGEDTNDITPDESSLFHDEDDSFGIFVRYRANEKDGRHNWWRRFEKAEQIELGSRQTDILICARDNEAMRRLQLETGDQVQIEIIAEAKAEIGNDEKGNERFQFPVRVYRVMDRPEDSDAQIILKADNREIRRICVRGMSAHINVQHQGMFVPSLGSESYCVSSFDGIGLQVIRPREGKQYSWTLEVDGRHVWDIPDGQELPQLEESGSIAYFVLRCQESGRSIGNVRGVILPPGVIEQLVTFGNAPSGWKFEYANEGKQRIEDRVAGFCRVKVLDPKGNSVEVGVPDARFCWWFENGLLSFRDMESPPTLHFENTQLEEFAPNVMNQKYLCLPTDVVPPDQENWSHSSYGWRRHAKELIEVSDFQYNPCGAGWRAYRFPNINIELFRYLFEPTKPLLCKDVNGRFGLFVPEDDNNTYKVWAFSDTSAELLFVGKCLAQRNGEARFVEIEDAWENFCQQEAQNRDALLAVMKDGDSGLCKVRSDMARLRMGDGNVVYNDEELGFINAAKLLMRNLPAERQGEENLVCNMLFFTTSQKAPYDVVKNGWREVVEQYVKSGCVNPETWNGLFEEWIASGFDPLLEGAARVVYEGVRNLFLHVKFEDPFDRIDQDSPEWRKFIVKCLRKNSINDDQIARLPFWPQGVKRVESRIQEFKNYITAHCQNWRQFEECTSKYLGKQSIDAALAQNIKNDRQFIYAEDPNKRADRIAYHAGLKNNNVANSEMTISSRGIGLSPCEFLEKIGAAQTSIGLREIYKTLLNIMPLYRRVGNYPSEEPTDREWLFCCAAAAVLVYDNVVIGEDARNVFKEVLQAARQNDILWKKFTEYQRICRSVQDAIDWLSSKNNPTL